MTTMMKACMLAVLLGMGAAQAADFRIGVVDTERVLRESVPAVKAEKKIEKEFSGRDQEIKKLMKQAKELQTLLEKDGGKLSDADHRNKERELTAMNVNLQRMQREFREDLNLRKNEELAIVLEQANKAIQAIAEAENYDLILQEAVYRNPRIDITDKVIKHLAGDKSAPNFGKGAPAAPVAVKPILEEVSETWKTLLENKPVCIEGAYFEFDSTKLRSGEIKKLNEVVSFAEKYKDAQLEASGHSSNSGTKEYNQKLSEQRAESVKDYLVKHGVAAQRITTVGYGETRPVADNKTREGRELNRRVEVCTNMDALAKP